MRRASQLSILVSVSCQLAHWAVPQQKTSAPIPAAGSTSEPDQTLEGMSRRKRAAHRSALEDGCLADAQRTAFGDEVLAADEQHANDLIAAVADVPVGIEAPGVALIQFSTQQLRAQSFAVSKQTSKL